MKPFDDRDPRLFIRDQNLRGDFYDLMRDQFTPAYFEAAFTELYPLIDKDPEPDGFLEMGQLMNVLPLYLNL